MAAVTDPIRHLIKQSHLSIGAVDFQITCKFVSKTFARLQVIIDQGGLGQTACGGVCMVYPFFRRHSGDLW